MIGDRSIVRCDRLQGHRGAGSRVAFEKNQIIGGFHRPHPAKEAKRYQVRDAREFLIKLGTKP
jgi:hypothetical protein